MGPAVSNNYNNNNNNNYNYNSNNETAFIVTSWHRNNLN